MCVTWVVRFGLVMTCTNVFSIIASTISGEALMKIKMVRPLQDMMQLCRRKQQNYFDEQDRTHMLDSSKSCRTKFLEYRSYRSLNDYREYN